MINKQNYSTASVGASVLNSLFIKGFITTKTNLKDLRETYRYLILNCSYLYKNYPICRYNNLNKENKENR